MERRKYSRVPFSIEVSVKYDNSVIKCELQNLSMKGAYISSEESSAICAGMPVGIAIRLDSNAPDSIINVSGVVVRKEDKNFAVKFDELDLASFIHIRNIVALNFGDYDKIMDEFLLEQNDE